MLIGSILFLCGCLLYVFIKPATDNRTEEITAVNEKTFDGLLKYPSLKRSASLVLPHGIPPASTHSIDGEVK
ncbi:hypothetical protein [Bacillus sp. 1P06AnD]|uniref:hypothetical protein n=1 Tax=Bacillus sp. 1P06AnD TaxID=3132208 RepID=UPI0039A07B99